MTTRTFLSTMRMNNGLTAVLFFVTASFLCYMSIIGIICFSLSLYVQHTVFCTCTCIIPKSLLCKYVSLTHVDIVYQSSHVTTQLSVLHCCITVECICSIVWVYLHRLIIHLIGSISFNLPGHKINLPVFAIDLFYTQLVDRYIRNFRNRGQVALRRDLFAVRTMYNYRVYISATLKITVHFLHRCALPFTHAFFVHLYFKIFRFSCKFNFLST